MLTPYRYAVKRRVVKQLMDEHSYTRQQARAAWAKVTDEQIEQCSVKCGVNLAGFDLTSIIDWIKNNWTTILQVAISIVSLILMFVDRPPNATDCPPRVSVPTEKNPEERKPDPTGK